MNSSLILKAIPVINEGNLSFEDFALATGLGRKTSTELVRLLARNEIGYVDSDFISFDHLDKMRAALLAIRMSVDVEDLAKTLNWKDFELLAANILKESGYIAHHSFRLKKPRIEIDVVGIKDGMALLIDCKHWKRSSLSEMARFASMQIKRAEAFVRVKEGQIRFAVPAILTLHLESITFADDVPVIPIIKLRSFLNDMHGYLNEIKVISHV
ncbi:MAG: restriction endonuclease [Nitrososphaerales archaeon]